MRRPLRHPAHMFNTSRPRHRTSGPTPRNSERLSRKGYWMEHCTEYTQIWNKLPEVIYVQFETVKTWRIDGLLHDNVFPVTAQRKPWFLDRGRKSPRLRITRLQFPLAPGFAITAHVAQGQTLRDGVIADFNISSVASVFTTYVAATRVTGRDKLLIMRPFPAGALSKGQQHWPWVAAAGLAWRPRRLGGAASKVSGGKTVRRMRGKQRQRRIYRRAMAARRRGSRVSGVLWQHATATPASHIDAMSVGSGFPKKLSQQSIGETQAHSTVSAARAKPRNCATDATWENQWPSSRRRRGKRGTPTEGFARHAWKKAIGRAPSATYHLRIWSSVLGYVADRPANKTAPRSATDASSPTPCGGVHGRGSGSKHVDALRDSVRFWRRSARKSRPSSKNGKATMPNDTCHRRSPESQCQGMTHRMASVRSFKIARMPPKQRHLPPRRIGGEQVEVRRKMKHEKTHPTDAGTQTYPGLNTYVPIVKSASRAQLEMETCRSEAIVANNFVSGMVSWFAATLTSCPTCGAAVQSSCARGRIRIKHKRPNGKACPTMQWHVKWMQVMLENSATKDLQKKEKAGFQQE